MRLAPLGRRLVAINGFVPSRPPGWKFATRSPGRVSTMPTQATLGPKAENASVRSAPQQQTLSAEQGQQPAESGAAAAFLRLQRDLGNRVFGAQVGLTTDPAADKANLDREPSQSGSLPDSRAVHADRLSATCPKCGSEAQNHECEECRAKNASVARVFRRCNESQ